MWIDKKGHAHTAAVPDPRTYVDAAFARFLHDHSDDLDDEYRDALEERCIDDFANADDLAGKKALARQPLPSSIRIGAGLEQLGVDPRSVVNAAIEGVPIEWRLDAALVIGDLLDEGD